MSPPHFTEPTTTYWQKFGTEETASPAPWKYGYPAKLPDSRILVLPIRQIASSTSEAVASLIINQASISVHDGLGDILAEAVREFEPEVIIGLPTLGLTLAKGVAERLGKGKCSILLTSSWSRKIKINAEVIARPIRPTWLLPEILVL
jgi:hypothetical protein